MAEHGQPPLYAHRVLEDSDTALEDAFHVSVAWSFAEVDPDLRARTEAAFSSSEPESGSGSGSLRGGVLGMRVHVDGVKAKIGNAVTHVALPGARGRSAKAPSTRFDA